MNDRARVPFALVGVVLLVSAATLTATVGVHDPQRTADIDRAMDGATAETMTELRGAADRAATDAAAAPVTQPANTTAGRALNRSQPFRDALRLRLYLRAQQRLDSVETRRGDTVATASLPAVEPTTEGYREAIERVHIERAGEDDAALRVRIEGVELTATRDGRTVATVERTPSFVVENPALLLHDRTERFERRATAPVTEHGVGQRLTARLYPIAWTRGYAQYGGAPISTVVGTRHVELATNDALLAEQRAVFDQVDPDGDRGVAAAGRRVATTDVLAGIGAEEEWTDAVLSGADRIGPDPPADQPVGTWDDEPANPEVTVEVGNSADHAFAELVGVTGDDELSRLVERAHTVEARVHADVEEQFTSQSADSRPGGDWESVDVSSNRTVSLDETDGSVPTDHEWTTRDGAVFDATETVHVTRTWQLDNETITTERTTRRGYRVRVALQARTVSIPGVPQGDLDGDLSAATDDALERALEAAGSYRAEARGAITGETTGIRTATAEPVVERTEVENSTRDIRERTREMSVTVPAPAVGAGRANPASELRTEITGVRNNISLDAGATTRERAHLAGKSGYLSALESRLERHAEAQNSTGEEIDAATGKHLDSDRLDGALAAHREASRPNGDQPRDPAGNVSLAVDTAPGYLTTSPVTRDRIDVRGGGTVHPLATRNVNVFSSPHGQVVEAIFDRIPILGTERVSLSTAAGTLAAVEDSSAVDHDPLEREVESATAHVEGQLVAAMVDEGVSAHEARESLETDETTATAALLLANGTVIDRAVARTDGVDRDRLRLRLQTTLESAMKDRAGRPRLDAANDATERVRAGYREELEEMAEEELEARGEAVRKRALGEQLGAVPAGLPLAPVPGSWYATANVWYIDVGGTYERFAVRSNRGGPTGATTYLRDGKTVSLDHDGEQLRLGNADRVSFRTSTAIVVVVPPGPRGVGDTDGELDERSPGWPP